MASGLRKLRRTLVLEAAATERASRLMSSSVSEKSTLRRPSKPIYVWFCLALFLSLISFSPDRPRELLRWLSGDDDFSLLNFLFDLTRLPFSSTSKIGDWSRLPRFRELSYFLRSPLTTFGGVFLFLGLVDCILKFRPLQESSAFFCYLILLFGRRDVESTDS